MTDDHTEPEGHGFRRRLIRFFGGDTASLLDRLLIIALVYTVIGAVYIGLNVPVLDRLESLFSAQFTVFADLVAVGAAVVLWPLLLISSWACGTAGCGVL